jgi:hypothetical protein
MYTSAPYKPYCKQLGYQDATIANYSKAQDKCFTDCQGNGRIMGEVCCCPCAMSMRVCKSVSVLLEGLLSTGGG